MASPSPASPVDLDVLIVGAGLSGIGMAHHLQRLCPWARYQVLEARDRIGGTWDLFRYPGVRSDSDMHTLGYSLRPWTDPQAIAPGHKIRDYIEATACEAGIDEHISFGERMTEAAWSSADARWTVTTERRRLTARFLVMCSGYYSYAEGHRPSWLDEAKFEGTIVHPQFWPEGLDYTGKRVAAIGSGATAVTLVPEMAKTAAHVTMVQRSPSYVAARPAHDRVADAIGRVLPHRAAASLIRWKNVGVQQLFFRLARARPDRVRAKLIALVEQEIGPEQARHFAPAYAPWDQRLCLAPDGDLFAAIRDGAASVVTGHIARFTPSGLLMADGTEVPADIVVTATGLKLQLAGGAAIRKDDRAVNLSEHMTYKGLMFSDLPNFASIFGYTNASWTLKSDLAAGFLCRLFNRMRRKAQNVVSAQRDLGIAERPFLDFSSGYIQRAAGTLPSQGDRGPWRLKQSYTADLLNLRYGKVAERNLKFR